LIKLKELKNFKESILPNVFISFAPPKATIRGILETMKM